MCSNLQVTMNSYCSFCASAGIKGPHDHFLRASKEAGSKVVCPKLLATECKFCGKMGHTARFCGEKLDRDYQRRVEFNAKKQKALDAGDWMDVGEVQREHPGFQSPRISRGKVMCPGAPKPAARIVSRFAALDMDDESSGDESCGECPESPPEVVAPTGTSWASIVKNPRAPPKLEEEDEALPALVFGKKFTTRWADEE